MVQHGLQLFKHRPQLNTLLLQVVAVVAAELQEAAALEVCSRVLWMFLVEQHIR
jgi:hypothetical protein